MLCRVGWVVESGVKWRGKLKVSPIVVPLKHAAEAPVRHTPPPRLQGLWSTPAPADFSATAHIGEVK